MVLRILFLLCFSLDFAAASCKFSVITPNVLNVGEYHTVLVHVRGVIQDVRITVRLEDWKKTILSSPSSQDITPGTSLGRFAVRVNTAGYRALRVQTAVAQYVHLFVSSDDSHCRFSHGPLKIRIGFKNGLVLVQTDKPIYTPKQRVQILVFPLGFNLKPKSSEIKLIIQNHQNVRVKEWTIPNSQSAIISKDYQLTEHEPEGNWTVTALYGHEEYQKTAFNFEVKKYVLPKFSVKIEVPPYILKTDDLITVKATSRYVYNKPVDGYIRVDMKVVRGTKMITFSTNEMLLDDGEVSVRVRTDDVKHHPDVQWFPEGARLLVVASVVEKATGVKEEATDQSAVFTTSPYKVKCTNTRNNFLPGLPFAVNVAVMYANKEPVGSVPIDFKVWAYQKNRNQQWQKLRAPRDTSSASYVTDNTGHVSFKVDVPSNAEKLYIGVETKIRGLRQEQNGVGTKLVRAYHSTSKTYLMLRQHKRAKVEGTLDCDVVLGDKRGEYLVYFVVARGQILKYQVKKIDKVDLSTISIKVTADMSPSARLVAYTIVSNPDEVVSDSILLDVEDQFPTEVAFRDPGDLGNGVVSVSPSVSRMITVKAPAHTTVAVMAVDKSVYLLNNENKLTPSRVFKQIERLDLGCGVGGGKDHRDVFRNAGVFMATENFRSANSGELCSTSSGARRRRSTQSSTDLSSCCDMGKEQDVRSCARRYLDLDNFEFACRKEFLRCCNETFGSRDLGFLARSLGDDEGLSWEENLELALEGNTRSYFPELWFYSENVTNSEGIAEWPVTIPDTITTWVVQAVGMNRNTGFGMAKPLNLVAFQPFFVSLKLPYSAQRGEQVAITATVFNYGEVNLKVRLYLERSNQFCSVSRGYSHEPMATLALNPGDAQSASFPIVPKKVGTIIIKVIAVGDYGTSDILEKQLLVLHEGVERRELQSFALSPGSRIIPLSEPPNAVPGSVKATIYLNGDVMTPLVTSLVHDNMEHLLRLPTKCGEQTASKMSFSVYILTYLKRINQLTPSMEKKAAGYIQEGFSREVSEFRKADGSFGIWSSTPGLTWLTAFVRKIFCQASRLYPITYIDMRVVCKAGEWISRQQKSDGSFEDSRWFSSSQGRTAFVLIALQECSDRCYSTKVRNSIVRARTYLERQIYNIHSIRDLAVTTYALAIVSSPWRYTANNRLIRRVIDDSASKTRHWGGIETTGYALLAQLALRGRLQYAGPIVTWLTAMQNAQGAFRSTHDTSIALQALSKYSERIAGINQGLDFRIAMNVANTANGWRRNRQITNENRLLQVQESANSILGETLVVKSSGSGEARMLVEFRYNKYTTRNESCSFDVDVSVETPKKREQGDDSRGRTPRNTRGTELGKCYRRRSKDKTCTGRMKGPKMSFRTCCRKKKGGAWSPENKNRKTCRVCKRDKPLSAESMDTLVVNVSTSYRGNHANTGMSIVDIGIFTGFTVDTASLEKIKNMTEVDIIETSDRKVVFYLNEIPSNRTIWMSFVIKRENHVGSVQPVPVNVYDYAEPSRSCTKFYGPSKKTLLPKALCSPRECVCSQDNCAFKEPPDIRNKRSIQRQVCNKYRYAFKGQVVLVDERDDKEKYFVTYAVKVGRIFKESANIEANQLVEFIRKVTCKAPELEKRKHYVFMGIDEGKQLFLDRNSWVRHWPDSGKDNKALEDIFGTITSATCKPGP